MATGSSPKHEAGRDPGRRTPPTTPQEALARAQQHARRAAAEALEALHALIDATTLAASGEAAENSVLAPAAKLLEGLVADLQPSSSGSDGLLSSFAEALDAEIGRWEKRSQRDPDARAVLRAFLGVRELLWEMGVRTHPERGAPQPPPKAPTDRPRPARAARVQRVRVEG